MSGDEKTESDMPISDEENDHLLSSYQSSLASSRSPSQEPQSESESEFESESKSKDAKFTQPPPSASRLKRSWPLILFAILCWLAFSTVLHTNRKPKVVHASRYSKDYKFRPAASPVITETLKDGRTRLRGALPEPTALPTATPGAKKKRRSKAGKLTGRRKSSGSKSKRRAVNKKKI